MQHHEAAILTLLSDIKKNLRESEAQQSVALLSHSYSHSEQH